MMYDFNGWKVTIVNGENRNVSVFCNSEDLLIVSDISDFNFRARFQDEKIVIVHMEYETRCMLNPIAKTIEILFPIFE